MKTRREALFVLGASVLAVPAMAQLGGLGKLVGAGKSDGGTDPTKLQTDLVAIYVASMFAIAELSGALSLEEDKKKALSSAEDIKNAGNLKDAASQMTARSSAIGDQAKKYEQEGKKLSGSETAAVIKGGLAAIATIPLWKKAVQDASSLDKTAALKLPALVAAVTTLPAAAKGTVSMCAAVVSLLKVCGDASKKDEISKMGVSILSA